MSCAAPYCRFPHDGGPRLERIHEATQRLVAAIVRLSPDIDSGGLASALTPAVVALYSLGWLDAEADPYPGQRRWLS